MDLFPNKSSFAAIVNLCLYYIYTQGRRENNPAEDLPKRSKSIQFLALVEEHRLWRWPPLAGQCSEARRKAPSNGKGNEYDMLHAVGADRQQRPLEVSRSIFLRRDLHALPLLNMFCLNESRNYPFSPLSRVDASIKCAPSAHSENAYSIPSFGDMYHLSLPF